MFRAGEEHLSAGDEHVENTRSNFGHTYTQLVTFCCFTMMLVCCLGKFITLLL